MQARLSKSLLFLPCGVFIALNFFSAYYITSTGVYNGDFLGIPIEHSYLEIWLYALIASIPYLVLYYVILRVKPVNTSPLKMPSLFVPFAFIILILSLSLTLVYGVGMVAQGIYSVPAVLKPFVVIINRIDALAISCVLLLSPYIKWRSAVLIAILMLFISAFRGSLQFLPMILFLFFYRFMTYKDHLSEPNRTNKSWVYILFGILGALIIYNASTFYEIRESIRGIDIATGGSVFEFIFGKLIGRLSNLSALLRFDLLLQDYYNGIEQLPYFSYLIDCLKSFWGGFIKTPVMNHYDYYTSINDPSAYGFYAMQTGVIPALGLSMMKSPIIGIFDLVITLLCIYYTVRLATFFLGYPGKYVAMVLMIFAILSGAPNQFSNPMINLAVIGILFLTFKYFAIFVNREL